MSLRKQKDSQRVGENMHNTYIRQSLIYKNVLRISIDYKEESEKVGLKLNIQKTKIMASGPNTPWEIDGETVETVRLYFFGNSVRLYLSGLQNYCR